jgi:hypothetical protein
MDERVYIPMVQVRSNALVGYGLPEPPYTHKRHELKMYKAYSGKVTDGAEKRIHRTVDVFLQRSQERTIWNTVTNQQNQFRLSFCTLTIPDEKEVDGKEAYKGLKVFIDHFRKPPTRKAISEQLKSYIWKAELQKRGQIHYHLTANSFLNAWEVRRVWNGICFRRGWMEEYRKKYGNTNPNSTDIHAVYKVRDIQAYLGKYLSKSGRVDVSECGGIVPIFEPHINGKVWDASKDLKVPRYSYELDGDTYERLDEGTKSGAIKVLPGNECTVFCTEHPTLYIGENELNKYVNWRSK